MRKTAIAWIVAGMMAGPVAATAQQADGTGEPMTPEQYRAQLLQYKAHLEEQVALRNKPVEDLNKKIVALDDRVEKQIDVLIQRLAALRDSPDSKTRMTNNKVKAMEALANTINTYKRERAKRMEALKARYSNLPKEALEKSVGALDKRIDERIDQILRLQASLTHDNGFRDYSYEIDYRDWGSTRVNKVETDASKNDRRTGSTTARTETRIADGLKKSIADLERENEILRQRMNYTPAADRAMLEKQIEENENTILRREDDIRKLYTQGSTGTQPAGQRQAFELEKQLREAAQKVQRDHIELMRLVTERDRALTRVKPYLSRLEAVERELQKLDGTAQ